jgi:hypothetical protein
MALYWISYDLDKPGQDYSDLIAELKRFGAVRILKSDWLLGHNTTTPEALRNTFSQYLDDNDRMMVAELKKSAAWRNQLAADETVLGLFNKHAD